MAPFRHVDAHAANAAGRPDQAIWLLTKAGSRFEESTRDEQFEYLYALLKLAFPRLILKLHDRLAAGSAADPRVHLLVRALAAPPKTDAFAGWEEEHSVVDALCSRCVCELLGLPTSADACRFLLRLPESNLEIVEAGKAFCGRDVERAETLLRGLYAKTGESHIAVFLAKIFQGLERPLDASRLLEEVLERYPGHGEANALMLKIMVQRGASLHEIRSRIDRRALYWNFNCSRNYGSALAQSRAPFAARAHRLAYAICRQRLHARAARMLRR